jgi:hypothetical protein
MSVFLPIVKKDNKVFVVIDGGNKELSNRIDVYKKVKYDGTPHTIDEAPKEYYDEKGTKVETPQLDAEVFLKLGKRNSNSEAANVIDNINVPPDTYYYMNVGQRDYLSGGRKPKRLSHLSKKRAMKSRRVRKSRRRYSRRKY